MSHDEIIVNCDPCFEVDAKTRAVTCNSGKTCLMQTDHNSERFGFKMPRHIEGHDMSICDKVEIHYINTDRNTKEEVRDAYRVTDLRVSEDDEEKIEFSWLISGNATQKEGNLSFLVKFSCFDEGSDKPEYIWNTAVFSGITISQGINNTTIIIEENPDALEGIKLELESYIDEQLGDLEAALDRIIDIQNELIGGDAE